MDGQSTAMRLLSHFRTVLLFPVTSVFFLLLYKPNSFVTVLKCEAWLSSDSGAWQAIQGANLAH